MIENVLKKIGLNEKEVRVYLAALKLGPAPVRKIAEAADVNRGTAYDILRALIGLGLVAYYHKDKHQYFIAEDPAQLSDVIKQKQEQLTETQQELVECIPQLKSIYDRAGDKPVVKYYEGSAGVKLILQDVLNTSAVGNRQYYVYSSSAIKKYLYAAYKGFSQNRIKLGIKVQTISIGPGGETVGLDERKWLTKKESAPTYTLIYGGKVAMISLDSNSQPIGVITEDKNICQTQKMIFEFIWNKL